MEPANDEVQRQATGDAASGAGVSRLRPAGWALGLPVLALLIAVAAMRVGPAVEIDIRRAASRIAPGDAGSPLEAAGARAAVAGRDVRIVTDDVLPEELAGETRRRVSAIPAVRTVVGETTGYVVLSPYVFRVRRGSSGIELSGGVPDAVLRHALVAAAGRIVPPDQVEDRLRLAAGAPAGFSAAASHLLATLGPIESAEGSVSDRSIQASASPRDPIAYNAVMSALRSPPPGFDLGETDILPPRITPFVWTVRRDDGGLSLGGAVPSEEKRAALLRLAAEMLPDLPVRDAMQTGRGLDRSIDLLEAARSAFDILGRLRSGEAQVVERRFTLAGESVAKGGRDAVEARLRNTLPHALGSPMLRIDQIPASPFVFAARRREGRIELSGYVPDERDRAVAAGIASSRYPGERIVDRLIAADGAPPGFQDVMRTMLETLADFAEGEASARDREVRYEGRVLYGQLAARLRRTAPRQVPEGWRATAEIETARPPGALDADLCADLLGDVARRSPVPFEPGQATPAAAAGPALEAAAGILRRCGRVGVRIVHHLGAPPDPASGRDLAADRARALAAALAERGATARFTVEGQTVAERSAERSEYRVAPL